MVRKKTLLEWDAGNNDAVVREMTAQERPSYYFGESVGILLFGQWYQNIPQLGHQAYAPTYDFPVRLKFVDQPFGPQGLHGGDPEWRGWNLPEWIRCAQELEAEGVRAIVGGCGVTGNIQSLLSAAVNIPVYTSTMLFVPLVYRGLKPDKKIGILTVSSELLTARENILFRECGIDASIPTVITGLNESEDAATWLTTVTPKFDAAKVQQAVVNTATKLVDDNPDIGAIVIECTDMTPYSAAIRAATRLPVFDAVDMVKWVHNMVKV